MAPREPTLPSLEDGGVFYFWYGDAIGNYVGTNFVVRRASPADVERIEFIWHETSEMLSRADKRYQLAPDAAEQWHGALYNWLTREEVAIFVADRDGKAIGYIIGFTVSNLPTLLPERYGYVSDLAVDSHAKTGGIGRELFVALKGWFAEQNVTHVEARIPHRHAIAQAFWRAIGATELYDVLWLKLD